MLSILITGSNKGIGNETARQLAAMGHHVFISARTKKKLEMAGERLQSDGHNVESLLMDVSDPKSVNAAAKTFKAINKPLDVLINNAAILSSDDFNLLKNDAGLLPQVLETNCHGPLRVCRAFVPVMNYPGRIINISSGGGSLTDPVGGWAPAYCVSKSLLNAMTRHLASELSGRGIAVNAVCPGWVRTDMGGSSAPRGVEQGAETQVWLATEAPQDCTGKFFRDKRQIPW